MLKDPSNTVASIAYAYSGGQLSALTRTSYRSGTAQTQVYGFTYNAWGQSTAISVGSTTLASYTYEANGGNLTSMTYGNGDSVSYTYDDLDRLTKTIYNDTGETVEYAYNSEGVLARLSYYNEDGDLLASYVFEYDSLGRLIRSAEHDANGAITQRTEHLYDEYNRLASQSWIIEGDSFSESYTYNDPSDETGAPQDGSLKQMTTATGDTLHYAYDALKRLSSTTAKDADGATLLTSAYAYKNLSTTNGITQTTGQVEFHNVRDADGTLLTGAKYAYDEVGNIIGIYESQLVGTNTTRRPLALYTYDVQNQLTGETIYTYASDNLTATPTTTTVYAYTYDTAGNILTESKNGTVTKTYTYGNSNWNDLLTAINGNTITYDAIGNPEVYYNGTITTTNYPVTYYMSWEQGRQLSYLEVWGNTQTRIIYDYDLDGIRTQKMVESEVHNYVTQNGKVVRETIGTGTTAKVLDFIYDESGRPFALKYSADGGSTFTTYYYVLNLQGDVIKLIEADGTVAAQYTYNAWGEILAATSTMAEINPLRY